MATKPAIMLTATTMEFVGRQRHVVGGKATVPLVSSKDTFALSEGTVSGALSNATTRVESQPEASALQAPDFVCDACPFCLDVCANPRCAACADKRQAAMDQRSGYTRCQVRRHNTAESCWLVAGSDVYDVTSFLPRHPAGTFSIVRHAGGQDCSEDLLFHSSKARKLWAQHKIGRLAPCKSDKDRGKGGCLIM